MHGEGQREGPLRYTSHCALHLQTIHSLIFFPQLDAALYELLSNGTMVLTASRRLAHWLSVSFAEHAQAAGLEVWPTPQVLPWSAFVRNACREQRGAQMQGVRLLSELQALALWERIVNDSVVGQHLLNPAQAARNAARSWQTLHDYRVPLQAVAAYPSEEAQAFVGWAQSFQQHLQQKHWLDMSQSCRWLLASSYLPAQPLALYGFDQLVPEVEQLITQWRERGAQVSILNSPQRAASVQVIAARDAYDELERAARWARRQVEQGVSRVAVVVPQLAPRAADVQRVFARIFDPAACRSGAEQPTQAFTVAASPLLNTYPLVHHALLCLRLAQGEVDTLHVGQLLRSPFLLGYDEEAAARAMADVIAREERREQWNIAELAHFAAANHCAALSAAMLRAQQLLHEHRDAALPSRWTERFTKLLQLMGWGQGRVLISIEQQTRNKFYEVLAELSALDELLGRMNFQQALTALRDACSGERFAPETSDQRVTVIDAETIAGMQFDALWLMGLHAGEWPPPIDPDPLLPIELQRQYRLPNSSAALCLQTSQRKLDRLIHAADTVILSWPQHDDDAELQVSPLLAKWADIENDELQVSPVVDIAHQQFAERPVLESLSDFQLPPVLSTQLKGGAQIFELQSRCGFRAQAQLRLHAEPLPTVSMAIEPIERGILMHRVLDELWRELRGSEGLRAALMQEGGDISVPKLTQRIRASAERIAHQLISPTTAHRQRLVALEVELATQWILSLLQLETRRTFFKVRHAEQRESFEFADLKINIQLDRIDELQDGSTLLIDYKTGDANQARDWLDVSQPGRPRSPQLPLYALAHRERLAGIAFAILAPGAQEFRGLANTDELQALGIRDYASSKPNLKPNGIESWDELLKHWEVVLNALAQQFLNGVASVDPLRGECDYCHLAGFCRITELSQARSGEAEGGDE